MTGLFRAALEKASWLRRVLRVRLPEGELQIAYSGRSLANARIFIDGKVEVQNRLRNWFRPVSRFFAASRPAAIVLRVWPWLTIRSFHLLIDGKVLYCDHRGELFEDAGLNSAVREGMDAPVAATDGSKDPSCPYCDRPLRGLGLDLDSLPSELLRADGPIGKPTAIFAFPRGQRLALMVAGIVAVAAGIGLIVAALCFLPDERMVMLGMLILGVGPVFVLYARKYRRLLAVAGTKGVAAIENDAVAACCWQDIDAVEESLLTGDAKSVLMASARGENHVFRATCRDGKVLVFRSFLDDLPWLGKIIQHETLPYLLPQAVAVLEEGDALDFGPLCIDAEGLSLGPEKRLLWDEMQDVEFANGMLRVKQWGKWRAWFNTAIGQVPNVHVLLALVRLYRDAGQAVDLLPGED